ncbi:lipid-A-disaccharide synthase [bacterium]|jgi:lipid-A-disaccharide synthase|nr:lipid-A-disaccharide synthase [Verrucomicrobiota bacterium]MDA7680242.1 lipid-A-disaccharide synthase [bacterium]
MPSNQIMVIAGEPSGDSLAAGLVSAIRTQLEGSIAPQFFGLGGPKLRHAGVELVEEMTQHTVFGLFEALRKYGRFKKIFDRALAEAKRRQPDLVILVDFGGFNLRFAKALRAHLKRESGTFKNWTPKLAYFVPPQVWASREGRAATIAETIDLIISIFPFEKDWYQERYPQLPVRYVGDPMAGRFYSGKTPSSVSETRPRNGISQIAILPGSRKQEIERHLPLMLETLRLIRKHKECHATVVTPNDELTKPFRLLEHENVSWEIGNLESVLRQSDIAIASSGTVTRECAYLRLPTVVIYKLSWLTYQLAKRIVKVKFIAMPNLLADKMIFPELIQDSATPTAIAQEVLQLGLGQDRNDLLADLERVVLSLGPPGATERAAAAVRELL